MTINAWASHGPNQPLKPYSYEPGELAADDVEIAVENCGLCHSDVSVMNNEWGISTYPVIPGHEVIGTVVALGAATKGLTLGQRIGVGWGSASCMHCEQCLGGEGNLCGKTCRRSSDTAADLPIACALSGRGPCPSQQLECRRRGTASLRRRHCL